MGPRDRRPAQRAGERHSSPETLLAARSADGWQSPPVLTKLLPPFLPNRRDDLPFLAAWPGRQTHKPSSMFLGDKCQLLKVANDSEAVLSLKRNVVWEAFL